jgi:hypothetical protein
MSPLQESPLKKLHPTQLTVGMIEVNKKRKHLAQLNADEKREFMKKHPMPAVVGPEGKLYITDHHHLGRAALEADLDTGFFEIVADLSKLTGDAFWKEMERRAWVHPLDQNGVRHQFDQIPHHLDGLVDDIYRSLAGFVRDQGYAKTPTPFAEFVWADFFRRLIPIEDVKADFDSVVTRAIQLAKSDEAEGLPGYE